MPGGPEIDPDWGEPGLSLAEKVFGWNAFEILAMTSGVPESPVNAIPPRAWARVQMRFVVGVDPGGFVPALRRHLDAHGFPMVQVAPSGDEIMHATRLDPGPSLDASGLLLRSGAPPASRQQFCRTSAARCRTTSFAELLGLPTVWVPHSYPGCSQHAPNEHLPCDLARQALRLMAGLYWDLGEPGTPRS